MATENHPDRNLGNEEAAQKRFKQIHEAYCTLTGKQTEPDNGLTAAYEILMDCLTSVLQQAAREKIDIKRVNVLELMGEGLREALSRSEKGISDNGNLKSSLWEVQGRLKGQAAPDIVGMIECQIVRLNGATAQLIRVRDAQRRALEILPHLSYDFENFIMEEWEEFYDKNLDHNAREDALIEARCREALVYLKKLSRQTGVNRKTLEAAIQGVSQWSMNSRISESLRKEMLAVLDEVEKKFGCKRKIAKK